MSFIDHNDFIRQKVDELWQKYDVDKSGVLEEDETKKLLKDLKLVPINSIEEMYAQFLKVADKNHDGRIEKEELEEFILNSNLFAEEIDKVEDEKRILIIKKP